MRLLQPLRLRSVALLWGGLATSAVGDQLGNVALTWIAVGVFGARAGFLTALQAGATLLAALFIGSWTDGCNERRVMIAADLARAIILSGIVSLWEVAGHTTALALASVVIVLAVGQAAFRPSVQTILPGLVSFDILPATNALLDATERLARLAGPALIILLAAQLPVRHFLTLDAISFMVSAMAASLIGARETRSRRVRAPFQVTLLRGFKAMRQHPLLGYLLATAGINNGAWYAAMFLGLPLLLAHGPPALLAHGPPAQPGGLRAFGTVIACYGVTNLAANLIVGSRKLPHWPARLMMGGIILNGAGIVLMGLSVRLPALSMVCIYAGAALAGSGGPMSDIPRATLMQTAVPVGDIAAAFRAWIVAANLGVLVAMTGAPAFFLAAGAPFGIALCGGAIVAVGVLGLSWVGRAGGRVDAA